MKKAFSAVAALLIFTACTKTDIQPSNSLSSSSSDEMTVQKASTILTSHLWKYNAFYLHYIDQNHKGDPYYVRGASNNQDPIIGTDRFTFKSNHNFVQTEGKYVYRGTWHFSDNATTLFMQYNWGTDEDSIVNFNADHLDFIQSFGYHDQDHSYTELMPVK